MALPIKRFKSVLANVKTTFSTLASFQTNTEAADATAALLHIHHFSAFDDGTQNPPRIVLDIADYHGNLRGGGFRGPCSVVATVEYPVPDANATSEAAQALWFWEQIEDLFDEFEAAVNGGGELIVHSVSLSMPPGVYEADDLPAEFPDQPVWFCQFTIEVST